MKNCPFCGKELKKNKQITCNNCGFPLGTLTKRYDQEASFFMTSLNEFYKEVFEYSKKKKKRLKKEEYRLVKNELIAGIINLLFWSVIIIIFIFTIYFGYDKSKYFNLSFSIIFSFFKIAVGLDLISDAVEVFEKNKTKKDWVLRKLKKDLSRPTFRVHPSKVYLNIFTNALFILLIFSLVLSDIDEQDGLLNLTFISIYAILILVLEHLGYKNAENPTMRYFKEYFIIKKYDHEEKIKIIRWDNIKSIEIMKEEHEIKDEYSSYNIPMFFVVLEIKSESKPVKIYYGKKRKTALELLKAFLNFMYRRNKSCCFRCGTVLSESGLICSYCGITLNNLILFCPRCGIYELSDEKYCYSCRTPLLQQIEFEGKILDRTADEAVIMEVTCNICSVKNEFSSKFCSFCGNKIHKVIKV